MFSYLYEMIIYSKLKNVMSVFKLIFVIFLYLHLYSIHVRSRCVLSIDVKTVKHNVLSLAGIELIFTRSQEATQPGWLTQLAKQMR